MKLAVVGAGWAGLSAALTAWRLGHQVHVFESAPTLGGRARAVHAPTLDATIDNGQHILLGAYTATLALMCELGLDVNTLFHRLPLTVHSADGTLRLRAGRALPAPLHIAAALLAARGLRWPEKLAALRAVAALRGQGWRTPPGCTVQRWLERAQQPPRLCNLLWGPLCIATLNTPVEHACAQLFAHVLRDSLGAPDRSASDMLIPRCDLTALWPARVARLAAEAGASGDPGHATPMLEIRHPYTVRRLRHVSACGLALDDLPDRYDAVVVCANTPSTARLLATLPDCPGSTQFLADLDAFEHAPIATLTFELAAPMHLPQPMLLLHEHRTRNHFGQWLFQGQDQEKRLLHVVVSDADALLAQERNAAVAGVVEQLREQLAMPMPEVSRHALIVEKRATFLARPGLRRPGNRTPWRGVWVAGDWTDTGYPAVLEGAVRSGRDAVLALTAAHETAAPRQEM
ncbi:NAD(P)-binding protein [bacterium SGD-2]|nr:NAD(P)-binding protein [bacterium SGD-2]